MITTSIPTVSKAKSALAFASRTPIVYADLAAAREQYTAAKLQAAILVGLEGEPLTEDHRIELARLILGNAGSVVRA